MSAASGSGRETSWRASGAPPEAQPATGRSSGQRRRLQRSRALVRDVLHFHRQVPSCAHSRVCDLRRPAALRRALPRRISWTVLFLKAFGVVAAERPILRQCYLRWPWPHVYEHPETVAMLAIERLFRDERWLFWGRFVAPESESLVALERKLERYIDGEAERVFRLQWKFSGFPTALRRLVWWWTLNVSGQGRAKRSGTCFLTTLSSRGVEIEHPPSFHTANLTYGPLDERGRGRVTLAYDHRLMDGAVVAECLTEIEAALNGPISAELESLGAAEKAAA